MQLSDIGGPILVVNQKYHVNRNTIFVVLIGFFFGFGFAYLFFSDVGIKFNWKREPGSDSNNKFALPLFNADDKNFSTLLTTDDPDKTIPTERGSDTDAQEMSKKVKVLCWIMTKPKYHLKKAINIKKTWGRRCTKLLFMSTQGDSELQSIALHNVQDTQEWRWGKTKEAIKYIYNHHLSDADWFLKADDDTFVIMENLRYLLHEYDPKQPYLFGCEFKPQWLGRTYVSGEAGYAMSKEAVKRFVEKSLKMNDTQCLTSKHTGAEDIEISKCLSSVNTTIGDSRDSLGRYRFMPFHPSSLLVPGVVIKTSWYWNWIKYPQKAGINCCSDTPISFHFINPDDFFFLEYMIYQIRPYGLNRPKIISSEKALTTTTTTIKTTLNPKLSKNKTTKAHSVKMKSLSTTISPGKTWDSLIDLMPEEVHSTIPSMY